MVDALPNTLQKCRGSTDMLPDEMARFRHLDELFRDSCLKSGYHEIRTPTLEYMHLFTSTGTLTSGKLGNVYSFLDWDGWSGERVVLRPDCTIPVARMYIESAPDRDDIAKFFYTMNVFAFERSGAESREKWQCGAEYIGESSPLADTELIVIATDLLRRLGAGDLKLKLSHVGVLRELIKGLALGEDMERNTLDRLLDGDMNEWNKLKIKDGAVSKIISLLLDQKSDSARLLKNCRSLCGAAFSGVASELDRFAAVAQTLDAVGCRYEIDMASARGFEYYTGITFEISCGGQRLCQGGRYDSLIPLMGGSRVPASGFALFSDRIIPLMRPGAGMHSPWKGVFIETDASPGSIRAAFDIAFTLREAGFVAELSQKCSRSHKWSWTLSVQASKFMVRGPDGKENTTSSAPEVLKLIAGK
ncbi:MAG: histidine--tRNA ligase family protein [Chloroflexi bacterium]|nr:histidine--tRNA ligase family protein [Chloroflexota bacterium]